jgi:hypothetical protein
MITINLSDKMAQKIWKKLQWKKNEVWVYLRNKLFNATGFPKVMKKIVKGSVAYTSLWKIRETITFKVLHPWQFCWEVLRKGKFEIDTDFLDECLNKKLWPKQESGLPKNRKGTTVNIFHEEQE